VLLARYRWSALITTSRSVEFIAKQSFEDYGSLLLAFLLYVRSVLNAFVSVFGSSVSVNLRSR
jgi:hypothetical protein